MTTQHEEMLKRFDAFLISETDLTRAEEKEKIIKFINTLKRDRDYSNIPNEIKARLTDYQNGFNETLNNITSHITNKNNN